MESNGWWVIYIIKIPITWRLSSSLSASWLSFNWPLPCHSSSWTNLTNWETPHALRTAASPFPPEGHWLIITIKTPEGSEEDPENGPLTPSATVAKALDTTIPLTNACLTLDHFQPQSTNSLTAETPCMIPQCKDHVPFTWNLKDPQKCAEDPNSSSMAVNAVPLEMTQTHLQLDAQQAVLFWAMPTEENWELETLWSSSTLSQSLNLRLNNDFDLYYHFKLDNFENLQ